MCNLICLVFSVLSENAEVVTSRSMSEFPHVIIASLITAMKTGSSEARILFPRLLQIVAQFPDTVDTFISSVCIVILFVI